MALSLALTTLLLACSGSLVDFFGGGSSTEAGADTGADTGPVDTDDSDSDFEEQAADDARVRDIVDVNEGQYPARDPMLVRVAYISDGDTVYVHPDDGSEGFSVRFIGVDTPEIAHESDPAECYGDEAAAFTLAELKDNLAWLGFDIEYRDQYDRVLAYVTRGEGASGFHNRVLARQGYASQLTVEPNSTFAGEIAADVRAAQDEGLGMWASCTR